MTHHNPSSIFKLEPEKDTSWNANTGRVNILHLFRGLCQGYESKPYQLSLLFDNVSQAKPCLSALSTINNFNFIF